MLLSGWGKSQVRAQTRTKISSILLGTLFAGSLIGLVGHRQHGSAWVFALLLLSAVTVGLAQQTIP